MPRRVRHTVSDVGPALVGLPPIARGDARVLVLGSMPGAASLGASRYYAHPANAFWALLASVLACDVPESYPQRCRLLLQRHVALWDVVHRCRRRGSLDADIEPASVIVNDVAGFLGRHPTVGAIFFNGGAAEALFNRHLRAAVLALRPQIVLQRLPSSSPANASWSMARKRDAWGAIRVALDVRAVTPGTSTTA